MLSFRCGCLVALLSMAFIVSGSQDVCDSMAAKYKAITMDEASEGDPGVKLWVDPVYGNDRPNCSLNATCPCASLNYAFVDIAVGTPSGSSKLTAYLSFGVLKLSDGVGLSAFDHNFSYITIIGTFGTEIQCGTSPDQSSPNVQITGACRFYVRNVTFTNCGSGITNIVIRSSEEVVFEGCTFRDNQFSSVAIFDTKFAYFVSCGFYNNRIINESLIDPAIPTNYAASAIFLYANVTANNFLLLDSTFYNNSVAFDVETASSNAFLSQAAVNWNVVGTNASNLCIKRTIFESNGSPFSGGALAISIFSRTLNTTVAVQSSTFTNNFCSGSSCTGGAMFVNIREKGTANVIDVVDTVFSFNSASAGGAVAVSSTDDTGNDQLEGVAFVNCSFLSNRATYDGTALGIFSLIRVDEIGLRATLKDCNFGNNQPSRGDDSAAVVIYHSQMTFQGRNKISNNVGGGISLFDSQMAVQGTVELESNTAVFGGGAATSGRSQIVLYNNSYLGFVNNSAIQRGGGLYVEYTSNAYLLTVLNKNCFLQYYSDSADVPPNQWNAKVVFVNNTAGTAGPAIFSTDFSQCTWFGDVNYDGLSIIFLHQPNYANSPFLLSGNKVRAIPLERNDSNLPLGGAPSSLHFVNFNTTTVAFGETVFFGLQSRDQLNAGRQALFSVDLPTEQRLGSIPYSGGGISYIIPSADNLAGVLLNNSESKVSVKFTLLNNETSSISLNLSIRGCHPGYQLDSLKRTCQCLKDPTHIARCDGENRYFYTLSYWVGVENSKAYFGRTIPGYLRCDTEGSLPGCRFKFDDSNAQCAEGREDVLCGKCSTGYGATFDLQFCYKDCGPGGIILYIVVCCFVLAFSLFVLHWDVKFPDELKGFVFFAQVIGLVYRNSAFLNRVQNKFFIFLINMLGLALPFPVCLQKDINALLVALLGIVPSLLATAAAFIYAYCCQDLNGKTVFTYDGNVQCFARPFVVLFAFFLLGAIIAGVVVPVFILYLLYRPKRSLHVYNVLTHGLVDRKWYSWYGVWSIWRRLPFVATNLIIATASETSISLINCLMAFICLLVLCFVKPYKKWHVNAIEGFVLLCLFCLTVSVLDTEELHSNAMRTVSMIFTILPFVIAGIYLIQVTSVAIWKKARKRMDIDIKLEYLKDSIQNKIFKYKPKDGIDSIGMTKELIETLNDESGEVKDVPVSQNAQYVALREPLLEDDR